MKWGVMVFDSQMLIVAMFSYEIVPLTNLWWHLHLLMRCKFEIYFEYWLATSAVLGLLLHGILVSDF